MTYAEAMRKYGSDKPDVRYGLEMAVLDDAVRDSGFKLFSGARRRRNGEGHRRAGGETTE